MIEDLPLIGNGAVKGILKKQYRQYVGILLKFVVFLIRISTSLKIHVLW